MGSPCPSFSRLLFPGGDGEAGAVLSSWISSLRPCPCLGGVRSGVGEGPVRVMPAGCGTLAQVLRSCGSCTGVRSPPVCSVVLAEVLGSWCKASERGYVCFVVLWSPELFFLLAASLRDERIKDQVTLGCVPSRCVFTVNSIPFLGTGGYCGSFQSRCAMVLLLIPTLGFSLSSGGRYGVDGFRRPVLCSQILGGPNDLVANVLFSRVHCASLVRPMSSLYPLLMYPYMYLLGCGRCRPARRCWPPPTRPASRCSASATTCSASRATQSTPRTSSSASSTASSPPAPSPCRSPRP